MIKRTCVYVQDDGKVRVRLCEKDAALCWKWGVPHIKHYGWHTWSLSRIPSPLQLLTFGVVLYILSLWLTLVLSYILLPTGGWRIFAHPVYPQLKYNLSVQLPPFLYWTSVSAWIIKRKRERECTKSLHAVRSLIHFSVSSIEINYKPRWSLT
jgi:hypothetical protein